MSQVESHLMDRESLVKVIEDVSESLAKKPEGKKGFGYDPICIREGHTQTFGVLDKSIKSKISHRARALTKLICWLGSKFNH